MRDINLPSSFELIQQAVNPLPLLSSLTIILATTARWMWKWQSNTKLNGFLYRTPSRQIRSPDVSEELLRMFRALPLHHRIRTTIEIVFILTQKVFNKPKASFPVPGHSSTFNHASLSGLKI
jgi:hypothetical protein